jgi:lipopolysaccharide biosynthesis regulator YciM
LFRKLFHRNRRGASEQDVRTANVIGAVSPPTQDTRAAINELSQVVRDDPEAVEIYLALGSLYRSQGEIERAIQIRNSLIVRSGLDPKLKARAFFELGRDFRRGGFLDRAEQAFNEARSIIGDNEEIHFEVARLQAERGHYRDAADSFGRLGQPLLRAHYLVRAAHDEYASGQESHGAKLLKYALRAFPGSVEAWLERIVQAYRNGSAAKMASAIVEAQALVEPGIRFVLFEGLLQEVARAERADDSGDQQHEWAEACSVADLVKVLRPKLEALEPDMLNHYYFGQMLLKNRDIDEAKDWFERALLLQPDFWLARLELFELSRSEQKLTPFFREQLTFFMDRAREVSRFYCGKCGLKRDTLFFVCPRCKSWHSIKFRTNFSQ